MGHYCYSSRRGYRSFPSMGTGTVILAIIGVSLLTRGSHMGGAILLAIAASRAFGGIAFPTRARINDDRRYRRGTDAIHQDAVSHGVLIPDDEPVWRGLQALYQRYERTRTAYPALASQYSELITAMWDRLRAESDLHLWRSIPRRVLEEWPSPWAGAGSDDPLNQSLAKAKRAAKQWQEAHQEAHSAAPL